MIVLSKFRILVLHNCYVDLASKKLSILKYDKHFYMHMVMDDLKTKVDKISAKSQIIYN